MSLSIEYRLWQILRITGWTHTVTGLPLEKIEGVGVPDHTYGVLNGRPWVFIDDEGSPVRDEVTVYDGGGAVDLSTAVVDWKNARVTLPAAPTGEVTADVHYFTVDVVGEHLVEGEVDQGQVPLISLSLDSLRQRPFAIGTMRQWADFSGEINIWARTRSQAQDLMDNLQVHLLKVQILNLSDEQMLGEGGDVNPAFDGVAQFQVVAGIPQGQQPRGQMLKRRSDAADAERHRSQVTFMYTEPR